MKYFGKKSWSSVMGVILHISWYVVLVLAIVAPLVATGVIVYSTSVGDRVTSAILKGDLPIPEKDRQKFEVERKKFALELKKSTNDISSKDLKDWEEFKKLPLPVKLLMLPYIEAVLILLLVIIKRSRLLFANFKNDIVFNKSNVDIISGVGKLLIAFSILTFNFISLLLCVLLFMLREIFRNGAALQEEHDLTV